MVYLKDVNLKNKTVLLRCDFNVPVKNGVILDNSKITRSLETINYLLENGNRVIIMSHFGRVKKEEDLKNNSLKVVYEELKKYLNVTFIEDNLNIEKYLDSNNCYLMENTRFTDLPVKRESKNNLELAKYWASFADVFVIDAFASAHRAHSSTAGVATYLPTFIGLLMEKELKNLEYLVTEHQDKEFVVIMGGAKVDDKITIIENLLTRCDKLVITGGILNTFLKVLGKNVGNSLVSSDEEVLESVKKIILSSRDKLYFSKRCVVKTEEGLVIEKDIDSVLDTDIIYDNIVDIKNIINEHSYVFLNGTCGMYEDSNYEMGTKKLLDDLIDTKSLVYVGGGDAAASVSHFNHDNSYTYISSGGGATLEYVATKKLKALEYIKDNSINIEELMNAKKLVIKNKGNE